MMVLMMVVMMMVVMMMVVMMTVMMTVMVILSMVRTGMGFPRSSTSSTTEGTQAPGFLRGAGSGLSQVIAIMPNLLDVLSPFGPHKIRSGVFLSCGVQQFNEIIPTSVVAKCTWVKGLRVHTRHHGQTDESEIQVESGAVLLRERCQQ